MEAVPAHAAGPPITIRRAKPKDIGPCGRICYDAFTTLNEHHNFPPDFPSPEVATQAIYAMFSQRGFFGVVAEQDGKIIGSNCMDERSSIAGIGPSPSIPLLRIEVWGGS